MSLAVVTGGTRGIGAAVSVALASLGHEVVALATKEPETSPDGVRPLICDVTSESDVEQLFASLGRVDILINNAGVSSSNPVQRTTLAEWDRQIAVNATGPFLCTRAALGSMRQVGRGRIVTVASTAALAGAPYISAYVASKHAALGLMRVVAAEVEGTEITANTVCPTYVRTDMTVATIDNIATRTGMSLVEAEAKLAETTPHGRIIEIAEVSDAVLELVQGKQNGQEILLDGGPK